MSDAGGIEDQEAMTNEVREIQPPEGVTMYDQGRKTEGGYTLRFGLSGMYEGKVNATVRGRTLVDGTFLRYEPGHINAHVIRRGIPAEEINRIGELSRSMEDNRCLGAFMEGVSASTQGTIDRLRLFGVATSESGLEEPTEQTDARSQATIVAETGIDPKVLSEKRVDLTGRLNAMKQEARQLGVVMVDVSLNSHFVLAPEAQ